MVSASFGTLFITAVTLRKGNLVFLYLSTQYSQGCSINPLGSLCSGKLSKEVLSRSPIKAGITASKPMPLVRRLNPPTQGDLKMAHTESSDYSEIMTGDQVTKYLHISRRTLQDWVKLKKIPYGKIGRKLMFRKSKIDQLIDQETA